MITELAATIEPRESQESKIKWNKIKIKTFTPFSIFAETAFFCFQRHILKL